MSWPGGNGASGPGGSGVSGPGAIGAAGEGFAAAAAPAGGGGSVRASGFGAGDGAAEAATEAEVAGLVGLGASAMASRRPRREEAEGDADEAGSEVPADDGLGGRGGRPAALPPTGKSFPHSGQRRAAE